MGVGRARDTRERLQAMTRMGSSAPQDLAEVYRTTYRALVRFLYRKVWDAERAEDLAQEAFARALVHRPENTRGWLFVVDRKSTRLNSSHLVISYAVFCLKKKKRRHGHGSDCAYDTVDASRRVGI